MNTDPGSTRDALGSARHSLQRPIAAVPDLDRAPDGRPGAADEPSGTAFAVVLRGYDRPQVDARLAELDRRARDEAVRADNAEAALGAARDHVRRLQSTVVPATGDERGFGVRVERVLHAAEREASELREKASEEAAALVERARGEAERARKQTEEALLGRAAKLDQEFAARSSALDSREGEVDRIVGAARTEADQIRADAERAAEQTRADAERRAEELLREAEETIEAQRADATRDVGRMAALRDEVRGELSRLHGLLRGELDDPYASVSSSDTVTDLFPAGTTGASFGRIAGLLGRNPGELSADEPGGATGENDDPNVQTAIGAIPPYTVASIGVLPFGDRSAGGPANGRSFAFELVPNAPGVADTHEHRGDDASAVGDGPRTSDDGTGRGVSPTRSTMPGRGRR